MSEMNVLIRADANKKISMGHVMRCLSIADALRSLDVSVSFVCASEDPGALIKLRGYNAYILNSDFTDMESEIPCLSYMIKAEKADIVIVDSYYVTDRYLSELSQYAKTVYIDDYMNKAFGSGVLINYNIYGDEDAYKALYEKAGIRLPKLILGPRYAPLRREFLNVSPIKIKSSGEYEVLLSTGGSDQLSIARTVAEAYVNAPEPGVRLNVLIGPFNKDREFLEALADLHPDILTTWYGITDMPGFLCNFDLALSAAGSTTYEICRMGLPSYIFSIADNQDLINETFDKKGIIKSVGNAGNDFDAVTQSLLNCIKTVKDTYNERLECSQKELECVDGNGALRIAKILTGGEENEKDNEGV